MCNVRYLGEAEISQLFFPGINEIKLASCSNSSNFSSKVVTWKAGRFKFCKFILCDCRRRNLNKETKTGTFCPGQTCGGTFGTIILPTPCCYCRSPWSQSWSRASCTWGCSSAKDCGQRRRWRALSFRGRALLCRSLEAWIQQREIQRQSLILGLQTKTWMWSLDTKCRNKHDIQTEERTVLILYKYVASRFNRYFYQHTVFIADPCGLNPGRVPRVPWASCTSREECLAHGDVGCLSNTVCSFAST